jgi:hypothetical protein
MTGATPTPGSRLVKSLTRVAVASNAVLLGVLFYWEWKGRSTHPPPTLDGPDEGPANQTGPDELSVNQSDDAARIGPTAEHSALPQALKIVGAIVAPTTLLTGLLFYFGRIYANGSFSYFGVNFTALDLSVSDYLIRSADGLIVPLVTATGLSIVALWLHQLIGSLSADRRRFAAKAILPISGVVGLVLLGLALIDVFGGPLFISHPEIRGIIFALGVILVAYAVHMARRLISELLPGRAANRPMAAAIGEWGALFVLVSIGLFWAAGSYASAVGTTRAKEIEASLHTSPAVTIFSEKKLSLTAPGVLETPCSAGSAYQFRYEGLTLVLQAGNQYFLLPDDWTRDSGTAFLLPRGDDLRLEFSPPGQPLHAAC